MKNNTPKRVSSSTRINGALALEMRMRGPRHSVFIDKKKGSCEIPLQVGFR